VYDAAPDPYCYRGTSILRNRLGLRDQDALDAFEIDVVTQRMAEPLPGGRLDARHYRAIHRHLFGDVYRWAGQFRSVRIAKGGSMFCYPENIAAELGRVFAELAAQQHLRNLSSDTFATLSAHALAELNAIHAFRDGNGRTQLAFLAALANAAGHPLDFTRLDPADFLQAMIASFGGNEMRLAAAIHRLLGH
jgi:cell filamentation protein